MVIFSQFYKFMFSAQNREVLHFLWAHGVQTGEKSAENLQTVIVKIVIEEFWTFLEKALKHGLGFVRLTPAELNSI